MMPVLHIARRELLAYFYSPIAYAVLCVFTLLAGLVFIQGFEPAAPAHLRTLFTGLVWILVPLTPALSMRLITEELRNGTIEPLMTSPVTDAQVILGKWLGAWAFVALLLATTLIDVVILATFSEPDYGPVFSGYLGLLLVSGLYLAMGVFVSSATRNQVIAFLVTVLFVLFFTLVLALLQDGRFLPAQAAAMLIYLNVNSQYEDFSKGLIDASHFIYFLSLTAFFLVLAIKLLESRKWR